jgi:hypothetical protein
MSEEQLENDNITLPKGHNHRCSYCALTFACFKTKGACDLEDEHICEVCEFPREGIDL